MWWWCLYGAVDLCHYGSMMLSCYGAGCCGIIGWCAMSLVLRHDDVLLKCYSATEFVGCVFVLCCIVCVALIRCHNGGVIWCYVKVVRCHDEELLCYGIVVLWWDSVSVQWLHTRCRSDVIQWYYQTVISWCSCLLMAWKYCTTLDWCHGSVVLW